VEKSLNAGMNAHINKPINPHKLNDVLSEYLTVSEKPTTASAGKVKQDDHWPDEIPGLDIRGGIKQVGGNEALYHKLLHDFVGNHQHAAQSLIDDLDSGDIDRAARTVHTIKGVAGNIGAYHLQEAASEVDHQIRNHLPVDHEMLQRFNQACDELCSGLIALFNENETPRKSHNA
jgi:HPt (histidine-containing phosphotransfer) domain-containing protein